MDNKMVPIILVVIIGVLVGVGVATKQMEDPVLERLVDQQGQMLKAQERMESKFSGSGGGNDSITELSKRIDELEKKLKVLDPIIKQVNKQGGNANRPAQPDYDKEYDIPVAHSPVYGNKDAVVTVVEFVDFQCPFCARFHEPLMEAIKDFPNDVNFMVKNFPLSFHPQAKPASKAAFAAGEQGKYFEMVDLLLANGRTLSDDKFKELAKQLGLNVDKFVKDYKGKDAIWEEYIKKDLEVGAKADVKGTPTFYINGKKAQLRDVAGFKAAFKKIIDAK